MIPLFALMGLLSGCSEQQAPSGHEGHDHSTKAYAVASTGSNPPSGAAVAGLALSGAKCPAHEAPKEWCFICDPTLREDGRLWCAGHSRYEDRCWECHPELQDRDRLWCEEHSLYEDECFLCRPELKGEVRGSSAAEAGLMCNEHRVLEAECGICRPEVIGGLAPGQGTKVRLPSEASARMVGVQTDSPKAGVIRDAVECLAEVSYNENRLAQIVAPVSGIVHSVDVDLGTHAEEQQIVAKLWSASIAQAVAEAVLTHQTLDRERSLREARVTSEKDLQAAEASHRAACQQLWTLGFTEEQIDELRTKAGEAVLLEVKAPFAGEIVERSAVRGALVQLGEPLFVIADRSEMWAELSIPETALARVRVGQTVELKVDALPGRVFTGKLTWIGPAVDERTRMARARAELPNPDRVLRDKMFARARILAPQAESALLVPSSGIQRIQGQSLVFVQLADDLFEARAVELGASANGWHEVVAGLAARDKVVVGHGFALKSQLLSSRLGAGCAHE